MPELNPWWAFWAGTECHSYSISSVVATAVATAAVATVVTSGGSESQLHYMYSAVFTM